jgi:hypothetical protein
VGRGGGSVRRSVGRTGRGVAASVGGCRGGGDYLTFIDEAAARNRAAEECTAAANDNGPTGVSAAASENDCATGVDTADDGGNWATGNRARASDGATDERAACRWGRDRAEV